MYICIFIVTCVGHLYTAQVLWACITQRKKEYQYFQRSLNCFTLIGYTNGADPSKKVAVSKSADFSVGWKRSQKTWFDLLGHKLETGKQATLALRFPNPQHAVLVTVNPAA